MARIAQIDHQDAAATRRQCLGLALVVTWTLVLAGCGGEQKPVRVASKVFTEAEILGDLATLVLQSAGYSAVHQRRLGGTLVCFEALINGEIDLYADYTGTLLQSTFEELKLQSMDALKQELSRRGLAISEPLGFNNTYAIGMLARRADELGIRTLSDLGKHPGLKLGFSPEFTQRADAWPGLKAHYGLPQSEIVTMQHELSYAALAQGDIDAIDLYSTDAKIDELKIRTLEDDRGFFPAYKAVYVYRADLAERVPDIAALLGKLEGAVSEAEAVAMNAKADLQDMPEQTVAAAFLSQKLGLAVSAEVESVRSRIVRNTGEHLVMVGVAMLLGMLVAIPIGFFAYKRPALGLPLLGFLGVLLTIPSLALLVFMMPLFGIGLMPAIAALFLYCLLPMAWNTYVGLKSIPPQLEESAEALGLSPLSRTLRVELPLAARSIMAGIKISTVLTIGFASLGGFIGAGGYGEPIYNALQDNKPELAFIGAIPAAVMAVVALAAGELAERAVVPAGLRQKPAE